MVSISKKRKNIIKNIKLFFKVPYLWGGKSFLGIDCSGLIQLILNNQNLKFPRNSKDLMIYQNNFLLETENLEKNVDVSINVCSYFRGKGFSYTKKRA